MKRLLVLLFVFSTLSVIPVQAGIKFGVKGGLNVSQLKLDEGLFASSNRMGFFVGPTIELALPLKLFTLDLSLLYDNYRVSMHKDDIVISEALQYVELPVNVSLGFGWESLCKFFISTGPQMALNIGRIHVLEGNYSLDNTMLSWNAGLGVRIFKRYHVSYNYNVGIGYTAELTNHHAGTADMSSRLYNPTHKVSFTYFF